MKISLAITLFNTKNFLEECIQSVLKQNYFNWEMIFVDDFSTDGTLQKLNFLLRKNDIISKCKIITHRKNDGYGKSLKDAVENSSGDLVGILDSDDALHTNDALRLSEEIHRKNPKISMTYSNYYLCDSNLKILQLGNCKNLNGKTFLQSRSGVSHFKVFKKNLYDKTEGVNKNLRKSVDKDLILKLEEIGPLYYIDNVLYLYRQHSRSITSRWCRKKRKVQANKIREKIFNDAEKRRKNV